MNKITEIPWEIAQRDFFELMDKVEDGETFLLTKEGRIVAHLTPIHDEAEKEE